MRVCPSSHFSHVQLFATQWTVDQENPWGFSRQEYWNGLPYPPSGDLLDPGIKPVSPVTSALQVDSLPSEPWGELHIEVQTPMKETTTKGKEKSTAGKAKPGGDKMFQEESR